MRLLSFIGFSKGFWDYENCNLEGKLCFWLTLPYKLVKYFYILHFDPRAREYKKALDSLERFEKKLK
jgi:hypothetical protein